jgi:uncharacterized protein (TIGR03437 family)
MGIMTKLLILILPAVLSVMPAFCAAPVIAAQGVKNAASYVDPQLPNGPIAQGSIFNIFGSSMGPATLTFAGSLPLLTTLGGTSINVTVNGTTAACFMIYTSAGQVAAILPSTTPVGTGTITVSYNGTPSAAAPITVAKSSFGIFTINQQGSGQAVIQDGNYQFNSGTFAFQPAETVVLWGTGLGPINGSDATTPPTGNLPGISVTVSVGGVAAPVTYYGRSGYSGDDQVAFTIPAGVTGCNVPLAVTVTSGATAVVSNYVTMAIGTTATCVSSTSYPPSLQQAIGTGSVRVGSVLLNRSITTTATLGASGAVTNVTGTSDFGEASFSKQPSSNYTTASYDLNYGACVILNNPPGVSGTPTLLDAGPVINVNGPGGAKMLTQSFGVTGSFYTVFGGGIPLSGQATPPPLYFSPGTYTASNGSGGKDVGGFNLNITVPADFTWTNYSSITSVTRSQALTVNWTGGDPSWDVYLLGGSSVADRATVSFECKAHNSDQALTVPVSILQALPPSALTSGIPLGSLTMLVESSTPTTASVSGLDFFTYGYSVEYQNSSVQFK